MYSGRYQLCRYNDYRATQSVCAAKRTAAVLVGEPTRIIFFVCILEWFFPLLFPSSICGSNLAMALISESNLSTSMGELSQEGLKSVSVGKIPVAISCGLAKIAAKVRFQNSTLVLSWDWSGVETATFQRAIQYRHLKSHEVPIFIRLPPLWTAVRQVFVLRLVGLLGSNSDATYLLSCS